MDTTSLLNNSNTTANKERTRREDLDCSTPEPEIDLVDYSEEMTCNTNSAPPQLSNFESLSSCLGKTSTRLRAGGVLPKELGVSPAHLPLTRPASDITYLGSGQQPLPT
ncbi:hypothetical protein PGT21_005861 [Puccinia graminis f. sp. tritici]|uniref:Uncharacterized protein n=1 Tax=Puccinia graminis f. sp. tritici TaxID=56615 RepID=A0A5B0PHR6_PUCGR|nr:hypothetical protein PGT21_005861 [Puccinia graminis f. sp. tritici]